ncbi:MAG: membrane protein insertase YidC, partial [Myxococcales bacterium]|nr:membrane protein insertase YidC [Myxococcales bacterium]
WGLAIILLTIVVKGLFYPLTHKSYTSMKAMQKLQPEMKRLKERLKDNKEELNRELMELYRRHKVNPFAGCFPIVLQIPVFFGLYRALLNSIELRHAPFGLWIHDLSMKDPYYITPVIMGVTMFLQQKMTPSTMDPAQARIMQFMPLLFTFMFLQFPSGLVIYWLVSNVLSIVQQYLINRKTETAAA